MSDQTARIKQTIQDYTAAWNTGSAKNVASFFASDGKITINNGDPWESRARVTEMAAGFFADVPDLNLSCDQYRIAGDHVVFLWSFTGHDANSGNALNIAGWEEWDLNADLQVQSSRGWFDAEDYANQAC